MAHWTKLTLIALGVIVVALALSLWLGSDWAAARVVTTNRGAGPRLEP